MPQHSWTGMWDGVVVQGYEGISDLSKWEFPSEFFPWLVETDPGLDFVVPDWDIVDGDWDMVQVGISLDFLVERFMDTECTMDESDALARRTCAIEAFEKAISMLRKEPLRLLKKTKK